MQLQESNHWSKAYRSNSVTVGSWLNKCSAGGSPIELYLDLLTSIMSLLVSWKKLSSLHFGVMLSYTEVE
eukprot:15240444-Ditylum_brightwellii.AAC.1